MGAIFMKLGRAPTTLRTWRGLILAPGQPEPGQVAFFPVVDAIQEFKIETNSPPAEFGRFNGGVINLTTKAGSNTLHGTAFEFFRHEDLNARNVFQTANTTKPGFRRNQFGGVLGGPVLRDRTFFFVDYQGQRQDIERTVLSTVPTMAQRQGVFTQNIYDPATTVSNGAGGSTRTPFANDTIPIARMDPTARASFPRAGIPRYCLNAIASSTPMIATTIISSTIVKPRCAARSCTEPC